MRSIFCLNSFMDVGNGVTANHIDCTATMQCFESYVLSLQSDTLRLSICSEVMTSDVWRPDYSKRYTREYSANHFLFWSFKRYNSFHEYSKSGDWPHTRSTILNGLNNHRKSCSNTNFIPKLDINRF